MCIRDRSVDGHDFELAQYDGIYIPRDSSIEVSTAGDVDIAEFSSDVANHYPLQVVRYADISKDPSLKFTAGGPTQQRNLNIVLGKNVEAGRLVAGFTVSEPGNWSSWPPHEHTAMLEEMYLSLIHISNGPPPRSCPARCSNCAAGWARRQ